MVLKDQIITQTISLTQEGNVVPALFLTKYHAMQAYQGSGGIVPHILDLGTRWRSVVSFMPWPLYLQRKSPWYPLRRLGGPQSHSGHTGEEKILIWDCTTIKTQNMEALLSNS
jgi:hypothetical protein